MSLDKTEQDESLCPEEGVASSGSEDSSDEKESKKKESRQAAKRVGRPPKVKEKRPVGRPKGDAAIINDYKQRMLNSPKSRKVLDSIFDAALNDDHKNQAAAWKLVMDRILPVAAFEKDVVKNGGKPAISINITGIGGDVTVGSSDDNEDYIEGEVEDANDT